MSRPSLSAIILVLFKRLCGTNFSENDFPNRTNSHTCIHFVDFEFDFTVQTINFLDSLKQRKCDISTVCIRRKSLTLNFCFHCFRNSSKGKKIIADSKLRSHYHRHKYISYSTKKFLDEYSKYFARFTVFP